MLGKPGGRPAAGVKVSLWHRRSRKTQHATTDAAGRYAFAEVTASRYGYVLRVTSLPPGVWAESVAVLAGGEPLVVGDLYLKRPQSLSGVVRDAETGKPVAGVGINFSTADAKAGRGAITTDAEGCFRLYVLPRKVALHCTGSADRWYPTAPGGDRTVTVNPGQQATTDFQVLSAPPFTGRVLLPDGKPAADLPLSVSVVWSLGGSGRRKRVEAARKRRAAASRPAADKRPKPAVTAHPFPAFGGGFGLAAGRTLRLRTDADGRFSGYLRHPSPTDRDEAVDIALSAFTADLKSGGRLKVRTTTLDPPPEPITLKLALTGTAVIRIVDPDGRPVIGAKPWNGSVPFTELGGGRYRAVGLIAGKDYTFRAKAAGLRCRRYLSVRVSPGEALEGRTLRLDWWGPKAVGGLIKALAHKYASHREEACRDLARLGPVSAPAVQALTDALTGDAHWGVRAAAAGALGAIGPAAAPAVPTLIRALETDERGVPRASATALGGIGPAAAPAVPALIRALETGGYGLPQAAATALGAIGDRRGLKPLTAALKHRESGVRRAAVGGLGRLGDPAAAGHLKDALWDDNFHVREAVLKVLGQPGFRKAHPDVARLQKLAPLVRNTRAMALALAGEALPGDEQVARVIEELRQGRALFSTAARVLALLAERQFNDPDDVLTWWWQFPLPAPTLKKADLDAGQMKALWEELAGDVTLKAYEATVALAGGGDAAVNFVAGRLKPISVEPDQIKTLVAKLNDEKYAVRRSAQEQLARIGSLARPALRAGLAVDRSAEARQRVKQLLEACARPYPALPEARRAARAIRVVELIGTPQAVKLLRKLAKGTPKAHTTVQAKAALQRLAKRKQSRLSKGHSGSIPGAVTDTLLDREAVAG